MKGAYPPRFTIPPMRIEVFPHGFVYSLKRRCLKIVKETIERQRLFHLAKIVEKGDLFKP